MAVISKIISNNKSTESIKRSKTHSLTTSADIRDPDDILSCLLLLNRFSKFLGVFIGGAMFVVSIIALTVMKKRDV
jgi:hypothetical protein